MIRGAGSSAPSSAGVYRMFAKDDGLLYVGKAKDLSARIKSYADPSRLSDRIAKMVSETARMELVQTATENEALLLEQDFIKRLKPKYNIVMRDGKSYPYLAISRAEYPRLMKFRGAKSASLRLFGPFPSGLAVNESLRAIQGIFRLRTCFDNFFKNRVRPCLLYQIRRCSAPCCGKVSKEGYAAAADGATAFLKGRDDTLLRDLSEKMEQASAARDYESAALFRDQIAYLNQMLKKSPLEGIDRDTDIVALARAGDVAAIEVLFSRRSVAAGNFSYEPEDIRGASDEEILAAFLEDFYAERERPRAILSNVATPETSVPRKGDKKRALDIVFKNAEARLHRRMIEGRGAERYMAALAKTLRLPAPPARIDVFDNSHTGGTGRVGAMVVAGADGFQTRNYRRYDIRSAGKGDDLAMMDEMLGRRYSRAIAEKTLPDLVIIDGGMPQVGAARRAIARLGLDLPILGLAKSEGHDAGNETLVFAASASAVPQAFKLPPNDPLLFYLERVRDEAHRFAITAHRAKRASNEFRSALDGIEGVGPAKKRALLNYFGSVRNIENASLDELLKVDGVSRALARRIYDSLR